MKLGRKGPSSVDNIWLWVYNNKIPIYPIFYLFKGDCKSRLKQVGARGYRGLGQS